LIESGQISLVVMMVKEKSVFFVFLKNYYEKMNDRCRQKITIEKEKENV